MDAQDQADEEMGTVQSKVSESSKGEQLDEDIRYLDALTQPGTSDTGSPKETASVPSHAWHGHSYAAFDAACTVTAAIPAQQVPSSHAKGHQSRLASSGGARIASAHGKASEGAQTLQTIGTTPAYSMLPWDKPGLWPAGSESMHSQAPFHSGDAGKATPSVPGATGNAMPEHRPYVGQPSAGSVAMHGLSQQPGSAAERLSVRPGDFGAAFSQDSIFSSSSSSPGPGTVTHHSTASHSQVAYSGSAHISGSVDSLPAAGPRESFADVDVRFTHPSQQHTAAASLSAPRNSDVALHTGSFGLRVTAKQLPAQAMGYMSPGAFAQGMVPWERQHSDTPQESLTTAADGHQPQHWLQESSDATVHITANAHTGKLHMVRDAELGHAEKASSKAVSLESSQSMLDSLPGAIQQSSVPCSLISRGDAANKHQLSAQLQQEVTAASYLQAYTGLSWPGSPSSAPIRTAVDASASAANSAHKPVNGQDVAVDRTMPSIWDLDL